ncbi:MAG TPA: hypothetical protein VFT22_19395 [Kofleriaceae bacterium]|nr:hypothetical protein [Kofleriaceae bacterium]
MLLARPALGLGGLVFVAVASGSAVAGPALEDAKATPAATAPEEVDCAKLRGDPRCAMAPGQGDVEYGVGVRLRSVWVPRSVLELFVDRAAGGAQNFGVGLELTRRRGPTELQLGFEYENVTVGEGVWINKGDNVANGDEADYVLSPKDSGHHLGWFTFEFTFINHAEINRTFAVRYGGGLGVGVLIGELDHYNVLCAAGATNANPEPGCLPMRFQGPAQYTEGTETLVAYGLPPVFPVVNAILGFEIRPTSKMTINVEGGIRTLPFFGVSSSYFF